ncbi:MAG: hypothetical protein IPO00_07445 [Betaproteobacteria bacterium]|nr:hypothetical protein [Betaproteobacteria bacterium]
MDSLRRGEVLTQKNATIHLRYRLSGDVGDIEAGWGEIALELTANDYERGQAIFFGDRPLNDPGYSSFTLSGSVGVNQQNDRLDVFRVEQRLKYFGFPAIGKADDEGNNPTRTNNSIQDFKVNGDWQEDDERAAFLFNKVINYAPGNRQLVTPPTVRATGGAAATDTLAGQRTYFTALTAAVTGPMTAAKVGTSGQLFDYLNAYNAPHWMNIYDNLRTNGYLRINSGMDANESLETYGTSWMRDLLRAYTYADNRLQTGQMKFNGFTDANHGKTPFAHGTHDLGMALDLGFVGRGYLSLQESQNRNETATAGINSVALSDAPFGGSAWSKQNAIDLLTATDAQGNNLVRNAQDNNQVSALKDFLALYSLTQRDRATSAAVNTAGQVVDTGDWDALRLVNEAAGSVAIRTALFGAGTPTSGLIQSVLVGSLTRAGNTITNQNPLYDMRTVLTRSGVPNVSAQKAHHNH